MYQDKMDIVGISATASKWGIQDGLVGDVRKILDVYGKDQEKLQAHSDNFKTAAELKAISWQGATAVAPSKGYSNSTDGSHAIVAEAREAAAAGEKLNVLTWGGETDLAQALHDAPDIAKHVRLFSINRQDNAAFDYIASNFKGKLDMWVDNQSSYFGMWKSEQSGYINGWHQEHADGHGNLGDLFADLSLRIHGQEGVKMGDSPTVLRFLSGDQNDPTKESWGGEFRKVSDRYYTDNPAYTRYGKVGAGSIAEDRAAWMGDFAERFDLLKDNGSAPAPAPAPAPTAPSADSLPAGSISGGVGNDTLNGNSANNIIFGLGGNDVIDGKGGADQMHGGTGNDVYWVDNSGDKTVEKAGEGYDWTHASVNWTLADHVEAMSLRTAANINGTGNASDNFINGNSGNNVILGMAGNDTLEGRGGNDTLIGGTGDDRLVGGTGVDSFRFAAGDGRDTVTDFSASGGEVLDIRGYSGYRELRSENGGTRVVLSDSDSILLEGVAKASLSGKNFRFDGTAPQGPVEAPAASPAPVLVLPTGGNLLVNGSFESSYVAPGKYADFGSVSGWNALPGGRIELWNALKGVYATDGDTFAELDFQGARDGFYQDVATVANQAYTLSFDLRGRPGSSPSTQQVEVVWNDKVVATTTPGSSWGTFTVDVTGTSGTDRLIIREVGSQSADGLGALLDDFSLVAKGSTSPAPAPVVPPAPEGDTVDFSASKRPVVADLQIDAGYRVLNIMPFGDSLTEGYVSKGNTESGGYRTFLWRGLAEKDIKVNMVGSLLDGPSSIDADHQGHRGWTINQLDASHKQFLENADPDVIMLMAGTNDSKTDTVQQMVAELRTLVTNISADRPDAIIMVGSLPPIRVGQYPQSMADKIKAYNEAMDPLIENLAKQGHNVVFVNMSLIQVSDMSSLSVDSGTHLSEAGYQKMADLWLKAFQDHLGLDETGIGLEREILTGVQNLVGSTYGDTLLGDGQNNSLSGLAGADTLDGRAGNDVLNGGTGSDRLIGGAGTDIMFGGSDTSRDTFVFNMASESRPGSARDTVHNFVSGTDKFDFSAFDANASASGHQDFSFSGTNAAAHSVWTATSGKDLILRADVTGDRTADFEVLVTDIASLATSDFLF